MLEGYLRGYTASQMIPTLNMRWMVNTYPRRPSKNQLCEILFDLSVVPQLCSSSSSSLLKRAVAASNTRRRLSSAESPNGIAFPPRTLINASASSFDEGS